MIKIELTRGYTALVDDQDEESVRQFSWRAAPDHHTVYALTCIRRDDGRRVDMSLHRFIALSEEIDRLRCGKQPESEVDHRDHNGLHNYRSNLRRATGSQNAIHRRLDRDSSTGFKGVTFDSKRKRFVAQIWLHGKTKRLGRFIDPIRAARAYDLAALIREPEFAYINFPAPSG